MKNAMGLVAAMLLSGCATERFGRLTPLGQVESQHLTCEEIVVEIARCDEFMSAAKVQAAQFKGTDVMAFLGDFGIGNQLEYESAIKSGKTRRSALVKLNEIGVLFD